jgi:hypothetical protein
VDVVKVSEHKNITHLFSLQKIPFSHLIYMDKTSLLQDHEIKFFRIRDYIHSYGKSENKHDCNVWTLNSLTLIYFYSSGMELLLANGVEFLYNHENFNYEFKKGNMGALTKLLVDIQPSRAVRKLLHAHANK